MGNVVLVGAGPGDPGLLTIRGKEALEAADCIIYDRLASPALLDYAKKDCEMIYVGKANHHHTMRQEQINELLTEKAKEYALVVRLKGGDPYVFGRGGEEALYLKERSLSVEVIPGVSSALAALADAGIPITHRGLSKGFQVVTAHSRKNQAAEIDYSKLMDETVTYVFLMGLAHLEEIATNLMRAGRKPETSCAVISSGTTNRQKKCIGQLSNIGQLAKEKEIESPAIIVVGEVVRLGDQLDFFEKRSLFGKRFLLPYIKPMTFSWLGDEVQKEMKSEITLFLEKEGAEVISLPIGEICPIWVDKDTMRQALLNDWIVFTSANGVKAFLWNLRKNEMDLRALGRVKIAVIGKKTAKTLEETGIRADLIASVQTGKGLAEAMISGADPENERYVKPEKRESLLLFSAREHGSDFKESLHDHFNYEEIAVYENRMPDIDGKLTEKILQESYDGAVFTSASAVKRSAKLFGDRERSMQSVAANVYSIGPSCSKALREVGILELVEAEESSYQGIIKKMI